MHFLAYNTFGWLLLLGSAVVALLLSTLFIVAIVARKVERVKAIGKLAKCAAVVTVPLGVAHFVFLHIDGAPLEVLRDTLCALMVVTFPLLVIQVFSGLLTQITALSPQCSPIAGGETNERITTEVLGAQQSGFDLSIGQIENSLSPRPKRMVLEAALGNLRRRGCLTVRYENATGQRRFRITDAGRNKINPRGR